MNIEIVIGANYGDEGKGLFTEYLCRNNPKSLVVMSNGGPQRGHTVNNKELGYRHIFHHFGSGTLVGIPTVFSKTYLLNPIFFAKEHKELVDAGIKPTSFRAPSCLMQLPTDMFINQVLEIARDKEGKKHGSCGVGIFETLTRSKKRPLTFNKFFSLDDSKKMKLLEDEIELALQKLADEGISKIPSKMNEPLKCLRSKEFLQHFIDDTKFLFDNSKLLESDDLLENDYGIPHEQSTLIVENAQGLLLNEKYAPKDEDGRTDVHTTPTKTGIEGALDALYSKHLENCNIGANYITRSYFSRHGAGPFPEYSKDVMFVDETNKKNDWQDEIRFGKMSAEDAFKLVERVAKDVSAVKDHYVLPSIVETHINEASCNTLDHFASYFSHEDNSATITVASLTERCFAESYISNLIKNK